MVYAYLLNALDDICADEVLPVDKEVLEMMSKVLGVDSQVLIVDA